MAVLTIEGGARQLQIILKGNRTRIRRHGLKALLTEKDNSLELSELSEALELKSNEVIELTDSITGLESTLSEQLQEIEESKKANETLTGTINEKGSALTELTKSNESLTIELSGKSAALEAKSNELKTAKKAFDASEDKAKKAIAKLEKQLETAKKAK